MLFLLGLSALGSVLAIAFGLWLNVAGMTVGMLIESVAGGSIGAAIHLAEQRASGPSDPSAMGGSGPVEQMSHQRPPPDTAR